MPPHPPSDAVKPRPQMHTQEAETVPPVTPRRVLMVAPTMFFADYGCHVRIYEEAVALRDLGHALRILAYPNGRDVGGLTVRRSPGVPFNYRVVVGSSRHKIYLDAMLSLVALHEIVAHPPDLIHAHLHEGALIGYVLSRLRRVPLIFDFQGSLTSEMCDHGFLRPESPLFRPLWRLERWIDHRPHVILTSSRHAADLLVREFGVPASRIQPVPDGVNADRFRPRRPDDEPALRVTRQELGIPEGRVVVVYLGLLAEYQGTGLLLEAARQIIERRQDVHFLIMGYPGENYYRAVARNMGLEPWVTFTGRLPYEQAPHFLRLGDVAVAPKLSATEGSGKLLNYMATALPTVVFDTPVSREYLGEWGVYAPRPTADALARALWDLLDAPHEWPVLGHALRQRVVARFSWRRAARVIAEVYEHLTGR